MGENHGAAKATRRAAGGGGLIRLSRIRRSANVYGMEVCVFGRLLEVGQHHVHDHACDRDVQPDRQRPARNAAVFVVLTVRRAPQRKNRERRHDSGERGVRRKNS